MQKKKKFKAVLQMWKLLVLFITAALGFGLNVKLSNQFVIFIVFCVV